MSTVLFSILSWALQIGLLVGIGLVLPAMIRVRHPRVRLSYWHALLAVALLLPLASFWNPSTSGGALAGTAGSSIVHVVTRATREASSVSWSGTVLVILGLVAAARLLWLVVGLRSLTVLRRRARPLRPIPKRLLDLQRRLRTDARLLVSDNIRIPVTFGWRDPAVLVPVDFQRLPPEEQESIVCHELIHVRRFDWPVALVEELVRAFLWFHPAVWVLLERITLAREQTIDSEVVRLTGKRRVYLEAIYKMAGGLQGATLAPAVPLIRKSHLVKRAAMLVEEVTMTKKRLLASAAVLGAAVVMLGLAALTVFPVRLSASDFSPAEDAMLTPSAGDASFEEPSKEDEEIVPPRVIRKTQPVYPNEARKAGVSGDVIVLLVVTKTGDISNVTILESPDEMLSNASLDAIKTWEFEPGTSKGKPVEVEHKVIVRFKLK